MYNFNTFLHLSPDVKDPCSEVKDSLYDFNILISDVKPNNWLHDLQILVSFVHLR